jgi:protein involved in polysaccharide export with SLBB domain
MNLFWKLVKQTIFACGLIASVILTGCASSPNDPFFSDNPSPPAMAGAPAGVTNPPTSDVARFRVGDTISVALSGLPSDVPIHEESIKEDGTITMPDIGHIQAAGKTAGELQNEILNLYVPKYYTHLTVTVKSPDDSVYYVRGEVHTPGRLVYVGATTVTKAITSAGDFTDFANHKKVWLIRANGDRIKVNCDKALEDPSQDPAVYPGDQIEVERRIW